MTADTRARNWLSPLREMLLWCLWGVLAWGALFAYEYYPDVTPLPRAVYELLFLGWIAYISVAIASGHFHELMEKAND